jgi:DNA mismatch repair protein MSH6
VGTTRLLKGILPSACIWTALRESEGFGFERTQRELNTMFATNAANDGMDHSSTGIPEAITSMLGDKEAVEALGAMIWWATSRALKRKV